jgi:hypothetical protein
MTTYAVPLRHNAIRLALSLSVTVGAILAARPQAAAAELAQQAKSLSVVPQNAAFYSASLRLKEQLDILLESKAYSKLLEIPLVQLAKSQLEFQWQQAALPGVQEFKAYVESPQGEEVLAVVKEMFSDELFVYGGDDMAQSFELLLELNSIQQTAGLEAAASGEEADEVMARRVRAVLEERGETIAIPTVVFGFRIENADRATRQLDEVQSQLRTLFDEQSPELSAHLQRDQIAGHEFLTLRLDGSMIPWEKLREETEEDDREELDKWREIVSKKTVAVALGVVDQFVLLSVGSSTDHLENFAEGNVLADHPSIERLEKHAGERIVSIAYVSEAFGTKLNSPQKTVEDLATTADQVLRQADVDDQQRALLVEDIRALNLSKYMPSGGDTAAIAFLTERGYEAFSYQSGERPMMDSSKPLTILQHVGGNPIFFVASRSKDTVADYDDAVKWLTQTAKHVEQVAQSKSDPQDWAQYLKYRDRGIGLLKRINRANREMFYPAFADNQGAFVLDTSAKSKQWINQLPPNREALPMIELGIVASVSDAEKLREGVNEYIAVVRDAVDLIREIRPDDVPDFELPEAEKSELADGGTLYRYDLPDEWGLDDKIAPNAGITEKAAAFSTMPDTTERLLRSTTLEIDTSLDLDRPAATVVHCKFAELIKSIRPWIDYGLGVATGTIKPEDEAAETEENESGDESSAMMLQMGMIVPQVYQLLDVISVMKSNTSITYEEDDIWVTHSETHIDDLE